MGRSVAKTARRRGRRASCHLRRRPAASALLPLLGLLGALVSVLLPSEAASGSPASTAPRSPAAPSPRAPGLLATPLLSPARIPLTVQTLYARQRVSNRLSRDLSSSSLGAVAASASCAEVVQAGEVVYQDHPDLPVVPASNMKLLTATALLDRLGAGYRFRTELLATSRPVGGVLHGDLYLLGGGDPLLRLPSFAARIPGGDKVFTNVAQLVTDLEAAGVKKVTGSVVGDGARYDSVWEVPGWPGRFVEQGDVGPLSALGIDDGFATAGPPVPLSAPPAVQSAGVLTKLARSAHVQVEGRPTSGTVPPGAIVLARLASPPLGQILGEVLRESDNTAMELMTKELGLRVRGVGSTAAGTAAVGADLLADGLPLRGFVNLDGSGLSPSDRVTCSLLVAALERAGPEGLLVRDLPVAGVSGTLADRLEGTPAAGRVHAKTGTLNGVTALSGWALPAPGQGPGNAALAAPVAFALVLNGLSLQLADPAALADEVALDLARYPLAPALDRFEPGL